MRNQQGFTLLEIVVSIVILGIALVPMLGMFSTAHFSLKHGNSSTEAVGLAQEIMEDLKLQHLKGIGLDSSPRQAIAGHPDYSYEVHVNSAGSRLKQVKVTVYYNLAGQERSISLLTKMGEWQ
ncbi:MAG: hypothetical protein JG781_77 [Peptococcaceae bacterium]|jgi:prepilin-type N-terminal cleavage/methylation domain-containing protein|nr:hypothetical protein [Peptococcaceae bacterium]